MGKPTSTQKIQCAPGIQRDGTLFSTDSYTDGEWVRFYRGLPKKMGGYSRLEKLEEIDGVIRKIFAYPDRSNILIYYFTQYEQGALSTSVSSINSGVKYEMTCDGTPIDDFVWTVDTMFDALGSGASVIVAHPGKNINSADNNEVTPVFFKDPVNVTTDFEPLVLTDATSTTGTMLINSTSLVVADATGFAIGDTIEVAEAGMPLTATIMAINGLVVTLDARARVSVVGVTCKGPLLTTTGTMSAGSYDVTLVAVTTLEVGDTLTVNGAGGLNMYANVTNVVGTTLTLDRRSQNAVAAKAVRHVLGTDGGIVVLGQYLVAFGSNGRIAHSDVNAPQKFNTGDANESNIVATKIVCGLPMRSGGGGSTSGLFLSTDSVIRMTFVGGAAIFRYDVVSSQSSVLSASSFLEYDGRFYWIGVDRFLMYNGAVQEVPNTVNQDDFFNNLNFAQRQKIWATKVPRYGEIWWFYPRGQATECTNAIIFNVRENTWYDVELSRIAGYYSQVFRYPIWSTENQVWFHEYGVNKIENGQTLSIQSSFTTRFFSQPQGGSSKAPQGVDQWTGIARIEPDFVQTMDLGVQVYTREYAKSPDVLASSKLFAENDERVDVRLQGRHYRFRFYSNAANGDYQLGSTIFNVFAGDVRQ